jgi:peptide/nickel transport system substrate-binding protein
MKDGSRRTRPMARYVDRAEVINPVTVRVHLNFPSEAFLNFLAVDYMKIVPKHRVEAGIDIGVFENVVGSGPFSPVSMSQGVGWEIQRNESYFKDGLPHFDVIRPFIIGEVGTEIAAFRTGRILMSMSTVSALSPDDIAKLQADEGFTSRYTFWNLHGAGTQAACLNTQQSPFDDPRVRRAINLVIDRQEIAETFGLGNFKVGMPLSFNDPYNIGEAEILTFPGWRQLNGQKHPDDLAEARALVEAAGAVGFQGSFLSVAFGIIPDVDAVIVEQINNALGFNLELLTPDIPTYVSERAAYNFDIVGCGRAPLVNDPDDRFQTLYITDPDNPTSFSRWSDPEVNTLFAQAQREVNSDTRRQLMRDIQLLVLNGSPGIIETYQRPFTAIVSNRISTEVGHYVVAGTPQTVLKHEHEWLEPE